MQGGSTNLESEIAPTKHNKEALTILYGSTKFICLN